MRPRAARLIASRAREPVAFHATYAAVAEAMDADAEPVVVWGRVPPHLCLGQSQTLADVRPGTAERVVRRPLGGGAVWVDRDQVSYAIVAPLAFAPGRPEQWYSWALAPALETFRAFGLRAQRRGEDLWMHDRKIAGSGAATIGRAAVVASSFLMRFPRDRFAECVAVPSEAFRATLRGTLPRAMTDWSEHGIPPTEDALKRAFVDALRSTLGWHVSPSRLRGPERARWAEWHAELSEPVESGRAPRVHDGLKLNAAMFLRQRGDTVTVEATDGGNAR
jgi:lipoate-protein ligase A